MAHWNGSVKSEPIEEGGVIDAMDSQMLSVIDEANACLSRLQNRSRNFAENSNGSGTDSFSSNNSSTSQRSSNSGMNHSFLFTTIDGRSSISSNIIVSSDNSIDSDDTVLCSPDEPAAGTGGLSSPIVIADDSLLPGAGSSISCTITRRYRRSRRRLAENFENEASAANASVIDLTNAPLPTPSFGAEPVVVLSSDEEDNVGRAYPHRHRRLSVLRVEVPVSIQISVNRREQVHTARSSDNNGTQRRRAPAAVAHSAPPSVAEPSPPKVAAIPSSNIICPICYEPLANRPAMSTSCGHLFCTECLKQSQMHAKMCPICKKPLTKKSQMHPVYLSTM